METGEIIALFHREKVLEYTLETIWDEAGDHRWILYVQVGEQKFVMKIASNSFTTAERVNGWMDIISAYGKMGYYSPSLLKSVGGNYAEPASFKGNDCVVWEEEYAEYHLRDTLDAAVYTQKDGRYVYHDELLAFVAKVAQQHFSNFPYEGDSENLSRLFDFMEHELEREDIDFRTAMLGAGE